MKAVYLTGFMGAGKTTIGIELARSSGLEVIDLDQYIEKQEGRTIRNIFQDEGEAKFREYESFYLQKLPTKNVIITTGGGVVLKEENRQWMNQHGIVIYLHCEPAAILERLKNDTSRPLLDGDKQKNIEIIFEKRLSLYREAHYTIDTTNQLIPDILKTVDKLINIGDIGNNDSKRYNT